MDVKALKKLAAAHGWDFHDHQENIGLVSFVKTIKGNRARINVYTTKMTVATALTHPKHGKTQLFRKRVDKEMMGKIFANPRVHTPNGYRERVRP